MAPSPTRRRLLAAGGTLLGGLGSGRVLAAVNSVSPDPIGAWPMSQHDPAGRSYAPSARPPKDGASVRWKRRVESDHGFAYRPTPVVAAGRVYAAGRELLVLDAETGRVEFSADHGTRTAPAIAEARAYRSPTLAIASHRGVAGLHANGGLDLFGLQIGPSRWAGETGESATVLFGSASSPTPPVAASGAVLGYVGNDLAAIEASSGAVRWRADAGDRRPAVRRGTVYVADYPEGVRGYDLVSGERRFEADVSGTSIISVTAGPDQLIVATDEGLAGVSYDGATRWRFAPDGLSRDYGAVALADGVAYAGFRGEEDNYLVSVDVSDGTERWRSQAAPEATPRFAPPSVADGVVYVPTEDGGLAAVDAGDGQVRWQFGHDFERPGPWSPPALVGETLYVIGNGHVYALEEA